MCVSRRYFLKCRAGSAAALYLEFQVHWTLEKALASPWASSNALHKVVPFDFGIARGVAADKTQYCRKQTMSAAATAAAPDRRTLSIGRWMSKFFNTTSQPAGHGFTL